MNDKFYEDSVFVYVFAFLSVGRETKFLKGMNLVNCDHFLLLSKFLVRKINSLQMSYKVFSLINVPNPALEAYHKTCH